MTVPRLSGRRDPSAGTAPSIPSVPQRRSGSGGARGHSQGSGPERARPPASPALRERPAPRRAGVLGPSVLPPCGHRGESSAAAPRSWPARVAAAAAAAATSTAGTWVDRLRSEGDGGDSPGTETPWDHREGSGNRPPNPLCPQ